MSVPLQGQSTFVKTLNSKRPFDVVLLALQFFHSFLLSYKPITCQFLVPKVIIITIARLSSIPRRDIKFIPERKRQLMREKGYANIILHTDVLFLAAQ